MGCEKHLGMGCAKQNSKFFLVFYAKRTQIGINLCSCGPFSFSYETLGYLECQNVKK